MQLSKLKYGQLEIESMEVLDNIALSNTRKIRKSHCPWLWSNTINLEFEKKKKSMRKYMI